MKQLVLFLALGITLIGNNFLTSSLFSETINKEKKEQLLDSNEKKIEQLIIKAEALEASFDWDKSIKYRERILRLTKKFFGQEHIETVTSLNNLALLYQKNGQYKKAESLYKQAIEIDKKVSDLDNSNKALLLENLGILYEIVGEYKKAESLLKQSLDIRKKFFGLEHSDTATSLNELGLLYGTMGKYKKAESLYKQAIEIDKKVTGLESANLAITLNNLALVYENLGQYNKAESIYKEALEIDKKVFGLEHPYTGITLNNLGILYKNLAQYKKAETLLKQALEINKKVYGLEHPSTAIALNTLSNLYTSIGENTKAESLLKQSLDIRKKFFGVAHPGTATIQNNLSYVYKDKGEYKKAESLTKQALETFKKFYGLEHPKTANSLSTLSHIYLSQDKGKKALPFLEESLAIYKNIYGLEHPRTINASQNLGSLYRSLGKYKKSNKLFRISLISKLKFIKREVPFLPISIRDNFSDLYAFNQEIYSNLDKNVNSKELALFSVINTKGLLEEIEKKQSQLKYLEGPQKEIVNKLRIINQKISNLDIEEVQIEELLLAKNRLETKLFSILPSINQSLVNIEDLIKIMPRESILVEYVRYFPYRKSEWQSPRYLALVLDPSKKVSDDNSNLAEYKIHAIDLGSAETLENKIKEALISIEEGLSDSEQLLQDIGKSIIQPITDITKGSKTWFITPDGELNKLPFTALGGGEGNSLLVDQEEIRLLTTGRELIDLQEKNKSKSNISYVFANPLFDSDRKRISDTKQIKSSLEFNAVQNRSVDLSSYNWAPLPGTAIEGKFIANTINAKLFVEDKAAAKKIFNIKNPEILHIASHSYYLKNQADNINPPKNLLITQNSIPFNYFANNENPLLRSGVVLAGANNPDLNQEDDGYLTALEITQLDWNGTELVVISGCESGIGEIKNGEGIYGLKRAISVAGAKSSLLSLWKVDDQATAVFMKSFYERLISGEGKANALINTQREFRNHKNKLYRHPYVWAAFQLSGDWRPIFSKKGITSNISEQ